MAGYVTAVLAFVCGELPAREASSISDFFKLTSGNFTTFFSFLTQANLCGFFMCLIRISIANLCRNMIHFHALNFRGYRSEEVISFF